MVGRRRTRRQVVGEGGGGGGDVGVEVRVRRDAVGPGEGHPLPLVLHAPVLEPHLEDTRRYASVKHSRS